MGRGSQLLLVAAYAGLLLLGALGLWALEGRHRSPRDPDASQWDLGTSLLFITTVVTTVGYGSVPALSAGGRALCAAYAVLGAPGTALLLSAAARRLTPSLVLRPRLYLQRRWGCSPAAAARAQLGILLGGALGGLVLLPAAAFCLLEATWSFWDAVCFCLLALSTVGLGEPAPAQRAGQPLRQLYQLGVAVYLLLGLTGVLLLAQTLHHLPELRGVMGATGDTGDTGDTGGTGGTGGTALALGEANALLGGTKDGEKPARGGHGRGGPIHG